MENEMIDLTPAMTPEEIESAFAGTLYPDPVWPASGTATTWTTSTMTPEEIESDMDLVKMLAQSSLIGRTGGRPVYDEKDLPF